MGRSPEEGPVNAGLAHCCELTVNTKKINNQSITVALRGNGNYP